MTIRNQKKKRVVSFTITMVSPPNILDSYYYDVNLERNGNTLNANYPSVASLRNLDTIVNFNVQRSKNYYSQEDYRNNCEWHNLSSRFYDDISVSSFSQTLT